MMRAAMIVVVGKVTVVMMSMIMMVSMVLVMTTSVAMVKATSMMNVWNQLGCCPSVDDSHCVVQLR